ncbi:hypothetical protein NKR23_g12526 [Pleurostoma richardsiae]|uniref:BZIP domain-containing protein n=1 Tax=Pleurostoma richardsiae TaxID=41990 RepID=A0AA38VFQ2_9PEZI|nr:hypothetical protein NKR23_g12526 [Pleurostoma richardsiae]
MMNVDYFAGAPRSGTFSGFNSEDNAFGYDNSDTSARRAYLTGQQDIYGGFDDISPAITLDGLVSPTSESQRASAAQQYLCYDSCFYNHHPPGISTASHDGYGMHEHQHVEPHAPKGDGTHRDFNNDLVSPISLAVRPAMMQMDANLLLMSMLATLIPSNQHRVRDANVERKPPTARQLRDTPSRTRKQAGLEVEPQQQQQQPQHQAKQQPQKARRLLPQQSAPPTTSSSVESGGEHDDQRARNRAAASKCRTKSRAAINQLEESHKAVSEKHDMLSVHHAQLQNEVLLLKMEILRHGECDCPLIREYIANTALLISQGRKGSTKLPDGPEQMAGLARQGRHN